MTKRLLVVLVFVLGMTGGVVVANTTTTFRDVPSGHYAEEAIAWAVDQGITTGCAPDMFCPDETVTRAQMVTFLYRFAKEVGAVTTETAPPPPPPTTTTVPTNPPQTEVKPFATAPAATKIDTTLPEVITSLPSGKYYPATFGSGNPGANGLRLLSRIVVAPENCDNLEDAWYHGRPGILSYYRFTVKMQLADYLTHSLYPSGVVDDLLSLREAWCSGVRDRRLGSHGSNIKPLPADVDKSKGDHDPREWWDSNDSLSPSKVDYPGWCMYLYQHTYLKDYWRATMDQAEYDFMKEQLEGCVGYVTYEPIVIP